MIQFRLPAAPSAHRKPAGPSPALPARILDVIGRTPVVALQRYAPRLAGRLFVKLEAFNPGGSMKDRSALAMLEAAWDEGLLRPGGTVIESSSGNMGIGLAQACAFYDLRFLCVVDSRIQPVNAQLIEAYGGRLERVSDPADGDFVSSRVQRVRELLKQYPGAFWPNQYANPANGEAHRTQTVPELYEAVGRIDWLFAAASSTGTLLGCHQFIREQRLATRLVAVDSTGSVLFGGSPGDRRICGMGTGRVPPLADGLTPDRVVRVSDRDCVIGCRRLVRREAILAGGSSGGILRAVECLAPELPDGSRIAAILPDSGARYLDTVFNDQWVEQELGLTGEQLRELSQ